MVTTDKIDQNEIIRFKIDGKLSTPQMEALYHDIDSKAKGEDKVRLLGEIIDFKGFADVDAFFTGMRKDLSTINKVEKYAVVSDEDWVESMVRAGGRMVTGMDVKTFNTGEMDRAMHWLKEPSTEDTLSVRRFHIDSPSVIGLVVNGELSEVDYEFIENEMDRKLRSNHKVRLLMEIKDFNGYTVKGFWEDLKASVKYYTNIDKVAVVGEDDYKNWVKAGDFLTPGLEMKYFGFDQKSDAVSWVK